MNARLPVLVGSCVCAMALTASAQTLFTANRLYVVSASAGAETISEIDYTKVNDANLLNTSTLVRTFGDATSLETPSGCAFGPDGNLYVCTSNPSTPSTGEARVFGPDGVQIGSALTAPNLSSPSGIAFGPNGHFFVCSAGNGVIMEFNEEGVFVQNVGLGSGMVNPFGIVVGPNGNLYVSDVGTDKVYQLAATATNTLIQTISNGALSDPSGMCIGPRGHLFVANRGANNILEFDENGSLVQTIGAGSTMVQPTFIAIGFDGNFYVSSQGSSRVVVFDGDESPSGSPHLQIASIGNSFTVAGPTGLAFSPQRFGVNISGSLYPANGAKVKLNESFKNNAGPVLAWAPGSRFATLTLVDNVSSSTDLASVFNDDFVFNGFQTTQDITATKRSFAGQNIPAPNLDSGSATLFIDITTGKVSADGQFTSKDFTGRVILQARNALYQGKVEFVKELK